MRCDHIDELVSCGNPIRLSVLGWMALRRAGPQALAGQWAHRGGDALDMVAVKVTGRRRSNETSASQQRCWAGTWLL
jgi:hypothetical protein